MFADLSTKSNEHRLDIIPFDTASNRSAKDKLQGLAMSPFHSLYSTKLWYFVKNILTAPNKVY